MLAEATGFDSVWVNDHFHPWFDHLPDGSSAHGGNCWSWLPAALERTSDIEIGTGVTAIVNRYHPANVAHRLQHCSNCILTACSSASVPERR